MRFSTFRPSCFDQHPAIPRSPSCLTDDPAVTAPGRIREVAAQANPVTRTFEVKVGLTDPPPAMRLGATVIGRLETDAVPIIDIPATALTKINQRPAVWIVDPSTKTVSIRNVDVLRFDQARWSFPRDSTPARSWSRRAFQALTPARRFVCSGQSHDGLNLSEWALKNRSLGRLYHDRSRHRRCFVLFQTWPQRDPAFIIKTMVVQAAWPGATVEETLKQVTERLERKLQETPHLDFLRSFTARRRHDNLCQPEGQRERKGSFPTPGIRFARMSVISATRCRPELLGRLQ